MAEEPVLSLKRCPIYTRKSTNNLLERNINSLVTQREICTAYVTSQRYRGWVELASRYDDGGHSGSGLERPALARLMQDIEAGSVDTVVVYKIGVIVQLSRLPLAMLFAPMRQKLNSSRVLLREAKSITARSSDH